MEDWSDVDLYRVTELYGRYRNLWDRTQEDYFDMQKRYHSYCRILEGLCMPNASVSDVLSILRELRCAYISTLRKMQVDIYLGHERLSGGNGRIDQPVAKWFWLMHGFLYDHLDAEERPSKFPPPHTNPSAHSTLLAPTCPCVQSIDIGLKKGATSSEDDPRAVHQERVTLDEKKWDKVDEENEVAWGNSEFSVTSPSHKGEILFIRAPRELATIRMNTVYEFPDRRMVVPTKMQPEDENQYNKHDRNIEDNGGIVTGNANVNGRKCCGINKGPCSTPKVIEPMDKKINFKKQGNPRYPRAGR